MRRPMGITVLSVLGIVGGTGLLLIPILSGAGLPTGGAINSGGTGTTPQLIGSMLLGLMSLGSGVGMLRGARWGWSLGTFYFMVAVARSVVALILMRSILESLDPTVVGSRGPGFYYVKYAGRLLVSLLLYCYLFRSNVREYFGVMDQSLRRRMLLDLGLCTAIAVAAALLGIRD